MSVSAEALRLIPRRRGKRAPPHALPSTGGGEHDGLACAARRRQRKPSLRRAHVGQCPKHPPQTPDLDPQRARCDSSACFDPNARATRVSSYTSPGQASPSARASANNTGRFASETTLPRVTQRHDGTRPRRMLSTPATLRPPRAGGVAPRQRAVRRPAGMFRRCERRRRPPPSARGCCVARGALGPSERSLAPPSSGGAGSRSPRPPVHGRP